MTEFLPGDKIVVLPPTDSEYSSSVDDWRVLTVDRTEPIADIATKIFVKEYTGFYYHSDVARFKESDTADLLEYMIKELTNV